MTDDMIDLRSLLEKTADAGLLRETIGFAAGRPMVLEVDALTGAAHGGTVELRIPKLRKGSYFPFAALTLEPRQMAGKALTAFIQVAYVQASSIDGPVKAMGMSGISKSQVSRLCREIGTSEADAIWTGFLRKLTRRGLRGEKLVVTDPHEGIKTTASKVMCATWQRCRGHFMRNALAHAGKARRPTPSATPLQGT